MHLISNQNPQIYKKELPQLLSISQGEVVPGFSMTTYWIYICRMEPCHKWKSKSSRHGANKSCPLCAGRLWLAIKHKQHAPYPELDTVFEKRRENQCLSTLQKIINSELALDINIYATKKPSRTAPNTQPTIQLQLQFHIHQVNFNHQSSHQPSQHGTNYPTT